MEALVLLPSAGSITGADAVTDKPNKTSAPLQNTSLAPRIRHSLSLTATSPLVIVGCKPFQYSHQPSQMQALMIAQPNRK